MIQLAIVGETTPLPVHAYREELYRFVLKRVQNDAVAEDIVQEALVKAYTGRETLKDPSLLRSWLYQIIRNTIIDHYRKQRPTEPVPDDFLPAESCEESSQASRELAGCLVPLLDGIPAAYREALRLTDINGLTQQEAADRLGLSLSGAKSRVQRGRQMLRDSLLTCCRVEQDRRGAVVAFEQVGTCSCCNAASENADMGCALPIISPPEPFVLAADSCSERTKRE